MSLQVRETGKKIVKKKGNQKGITQRREKNPPSKVSPQQGHCGIVQQTLFACGNSPGEHANPDYCYNDCKTINNTEGGERRLVAYSLGGTRWSTRTALIAMLSPQVGGLGSEKWLRRVYTSVTGPLGGQSLGISWKG